MGIETLDVQTLARIKSGEFPRVAWELKRPGAEASSRQDGEFPRVAWELKQDALRDKHLSFVVNSRA